MNVRILVTLTLLSIGAARADVTPTPATPTTTTVTVKANTKVLQDLIAGGATVSVLDKDGNVLASVNADGTLTPTEGADLTKAASIQVGATAADGTTTTRTYTLAGSLDKSGQIKVEALNVKDKGQTVPLTALLHRNAEAAHAANAERKAAADAGKPEAKPEQPEQVSGGQDKAGQEKTAPEKPAQAANGKGKNK